MTAPATDPTEPAPPGSSVAPEDQAPLDRRIVLLLAVAAGATVANIYYAQPLLNLIGQSFGVSATSAGFIAAASQLGYAVGLGLLVPLGDIVERRRLLTGILLASGVAALLCAASPGFAPLVVAVAVLGLLSVVAQISVPLASSLAADHERGQVIGTVMSGLLIGILLARTLAGLIAEVGGWRLVFVVAALAMVALATVLRRVLPESPPVEDVTYRAALRSVFSLIADEPILRQRMAMGFCSMAAFSTLWTAVVFLLGGPHYGYGEGVIGLFGLAGLAGVAAAPIAGRIADRGHGGKATTAFLSLLVVSWGLLAAGSSSLIPLIIGIVLLDLGAQGGQIGNQSAIYALRPEARSRLTTAYMVTFFTGGVAGSTLASVVYGAAGWHATCLLGAGFSATALLLWGATHRIGAAQRQAAAG